MDGWYYEELGVPDDPTGPRAFGAFSPRLAAIFMPGDDDTVELLAGSGFRAPSTFEFTYNDGGFTQIRNPELAQETVDMLELESARRLPGGVTAIGSLYGTALLGLIDEVGAATEDDPLHLVNRDSPALIADVTLSGDVAPLLHLHYAVSVRNALDWRYTRSAGRSKRRACRKMGAPSTFSRGSRYEGSVLPRVAGPRGARHRVRAHASSVRRLRLRPNPHLRRSGNRAVLCLP